MKVKLTVILLLAFANISLGQVCPGEPGVLKWKIWTGLDDADLPALQADEFYPTQPDITIPIYNVQTSYNYDDGYGSRIEGFIHVPTSGNVTFNLTSDERAWFYLSTSSDPLDTVLTAYNEYWTNQEEHTKYPSQTSTTVYLETGIDYYFVIDHVAGNWQDFLNLWWQSDFLPNDEWHIVSGQYLKGTSCDPVACLERGQPCNDGDASTTDDRLDGNCNCIGTPITSNTCVGSLKTIQAYEYHNIAGGSLSSLYNAPAFPAAPDYSFSPTTVKREYSGEENMGTQIQGYLIVPITGYYQFNLCGDDNTIFYLSSDDHPSNKEDNMVMVPGWTSTYEQDKYPEQTSETIYLEKGRYYYFELNHKQGSGGNHFQLFWKTPQFTTEWKEVSDFYIYSYDCQLACIPESTPCDDGNHFTNNDQYNDNCECVGTPCSGPDCDDLIANYVPYEKCGLTDGLDNREENNWLSCQTSTNPNPLRSNSHWLMVDLGERYNVLSSQVWNYNVAGATQNGMTNVAIDYSEDGVNWTELGIYNWPQADGSDQYGGFQGPDFGSVYAQYILITSLNHSAACQGLGKIAFDAVLCPVAGAPCDDHNAFTIDDVYDGNCNCTGVNLEQNNCTDENILVDTDVDTPTKFAASKTIISSSIMLASSVGMVAGQYVELLPGFETTVGENYLASVTDCTSGMIVPQVIAVDSFKTVQKHRDFAVRVINEEQSDYIIIDYYLPGAGSVDITLEDVSSAYYIKEMNYLNPGFYQKIIARKKLIGQELIIQLDWGGSILTEKVVLF